MEEDRAQIYVRPSPWTRLLAMIILAMAFGVGQSLMFLIAIVQFIWTLIDKEPNENLLNFSKALAKWMFQAAKFLTFVSDDRPFPWASWPNE